MAQRIDVPGMGVVEFPDDMGDDQIAEAIQKNSPKPKLNANTELSWGEKAASALMPKFLEGNLRGSAVGRAMQGAADPGVAIAQVVGNLAGQGEAVNKSIQDTEAKYQAARGEAGSTGFDPMRLAGGVAITAPLGGALGGASTIGKGALQGAAFSALQPVNEGDTFFSDKAKQIGIGAATGALATPLMGALARVVSPKASLNPDLKLLQDAGVRVTPGQALGGIANATEQKMQSLPIMGDAITAARNRAKEQFNNVAINRTVTPIGQKIEGAGFESVRDAGNALSKEYDAALGSINGVNFNTPTFNQNLGQLQQMSDSLVPQMKDKFDKVLNNIVLGRMSPNGSMLPEVFKKVDSELGKLSSGYQKSQLASEKEFGDAIKQLKDNLFNEVKLSNPQVADRLAAADAGWANLVRIEGASKSAKNSGGVFTPGQLNTAIQTADQSTRKRAVGRGTALMQDLGEAGSKVLGNNYPDSGSAGRFFLGAGALSSAAINPAIPAALIGGAAAYTPPIQNALVALLTKRPDMAPQIANYLREINPAITTGAATAGLLQ